MSVTPLPWDSQHFEIPIAQIIAPELNDAELWDILSYTKGKGYRLVYWATSPDRNVPTTLLRNFSGFLVDRKVNYRGELTVKSPSSQIKSPSGHLKVIEHPQSPANQQLLSLALLAGGYSRFHIDPHIPSEKLVSMYHIWINRSTLHELADVVFVVANYSNIHEYLGVVTASAKDGIGKIGLIAVQKESQGQGVGTLLIKTVHQWMVSQGMNISEVVTQRDNVPACKLYERSGYLLASLQHYYHFWVQL